MKMKIPATRMRKPMSWTTDHSLRPSPKLQNRMRKRTRIRRIKGMDHNHNDPDEEGSDGLEEVTDNRVGVLGHRRRAEGSHTLVTLIEQRLKRRRTTTERMLMVRIRGLFMLQKRIQRVGRGHTTCRWHQ